MRFQHGGVDGLAVEPLLQIVERRDLAVRASPAARRRARRPRGSASTTSGKAARDIVAGARKEALLAALMRRPARGCRPISIRRRSPSASSAASSLSSIGCDSISGRKIGAAPSSGRGAVPCEPGEQLGIGRREPVPDLLDLGRAACPTIRRAPSWRAAPRRRRASAPVRSLSSAQRPVASSRSSQSASRRRHLGAAAPPAASRRSSASRGGSRLRRASPARSARRSRRCRRHSRGTGRTAPDRRAARAARRRMRRSGSLKNSPSVSAASAQPRSGSGVAAK